MVFTRNNLNYHKLCLETGVDSFDSWRRLHGEVSGGQDAGRVIVVLKLAVAKRHWTRRPILGKNVQMRGIENDKSYFHKILTSDLETFVQTWK